MKEWRDVNVCVSATTGEETPCCSDCSEELLNGMEAFRNDDGDYLCTSCADKLDLQF